uniref:FHA domain-containing protein n=1 Tax=Calcidiscus leptoporus TaxID=127549 RepID=A0A7S0NWA3_9EUKA|mmetsp:Transcript_33317/g.77918  ORF Transcript_33317/g.77918 Transcript_33317/m.77918 type:complete len:257 (+) Transcript_33317:308-1078(+)
MVPHDSVSRRHAALLHGAPAADGAASVHIIDLGSTKGTYVDQGSGWKRLPPKAPTLLPPGGRVRLGDCSTLLVRPAAPHSAAAVADSADAADAPLFSGLLQSTVIVGPPQARSGSQTAVAAAPAANEEQANFEQFVAALPGSNGVGASAEAQGEEEEDGAPKQLSNNDLRASLLPFLQKRPEMESKADEKKKKKKKRKAATGIDDSDDESDGEPAPPIVLDKSAAETAAGFVLRKQKTTSKAGKKVSESSKIKIKF